MEAVAEFFPKLPAWASWCLCNPGVLVCDDLQLSSTNGVQQGDPIGPLLFAAGLLKAL